MAQVSNLRPFHYLSVGLLLLLGAALLAPMLVYPFGSDHGSFATTADVLRRGGTLYREVWEIKPPGIYYLFAAAFATFGRSMSAVRLLDLLWTLAAAGVLALVGWRLLSWWAGVIGAFCFLTFYALGFDYWHTAQCDGFTSLPLALAALVVLIAEERRSKSLALSAGALVGLGMLLKFTVAGFLALPLLAVLTARGEPHKSRTPRALCYLLGCALPLALTALLLARAGTLHDMLQVVITWNSEYGRIRVGGAPVKVLRFLLGGEFLVLQLIGALSIAGVVSLILDRRSRPLWWFLPTWALMMILGIAAQGKYFAYHWLPLVPPVGLLAGQGLLFARDRFSQPFSGLGRKAITAACAVTLLALVGTAYWAHFQGSLRYLLGSTTREQYLAEFVNPGGYFSFPADLAVAEYVTGHSDPTDHIFIWGLEPLVYFLADRPPASRFIHDALLLSPWSPESWRSLAMDDLRRTRPKFILVVHNDAQPWATGWGGDSFSYLGNYPALRDLIVGQYHAVGRLEDFDIWERR